MRAGFKVTREMAQLEDAAAEQIVQMTEEPTQPVGEPVNMTGKPVPPAEPPVQPAELDVQPDQSVERMRGAARELEEMAGREDMSGRLQYMRQVQQWISYVEQSMQKLEDRADLLDKKIAALRTSQNPVDVYRKVLKPLTEWIQTWQEIARDQPENAQVICEKLDEASRVIEEEGSLYGVRRFRSKPGDPFDGERMMADENVVETNDPECSGKILESLGDGWELSGYFFEEKVRAYRYVEAPEQQEK